MDSVITWCADKIFTLLKLKFQNDIDRFEKIYTPLFDNLTLTHQFYIVTFNRVNNLLPVHNKEFGGAFVRFSTNRNDIMNRFEIGDNSYKLVIQEAKQFLDESRIEKLHLREQIRGYATEILKSIASQKEKMFAWSVMNYFINYKCNPTDISKDEYAIDNLELEDIISDGVNRATRSISEYVSKELFQMESAEEIRKEINKIIDMLNRFYITASMQYMSLKLDIY